MRPSSIEPNSLKSARSWQSHGCGIRWSDEGKPGRISTVEISVLLKFERPRSRQIQGLGARYLNVGPCRIEMGVRKKCFFTAADNREQDTPGPGAPE
jgi:hypothetical protein